MKRNILLATLGLAMVLSAVSCNRKAAMSTDDSVAYAVDGIYSHVVSCYNKGLDSCDTFNRRYLSKDYNSYIDDMSDFLNIHGLPHQEFWDYDRWMMAQDWGEVTYSIDSVWNNHDGYYWATVSLHNQSKDTQFHLLLGKEGGQWKIADLRCYDWDTPSEIQRISDFIAFYGRE